MTKIDAEARPKKNIQDPLGHTLRVPIFGSEFDVMAAGRWEKVCGEWWAVDNELKYLIRPITGYRVIKVPNFTFKALRQIGLLDGESKLVPWAAKWMRDRGLRTFLTVSTEFGHRLSTGDHVSLQMLLGSDLEGPEWPVCNAFCRTCNRKLEESDHTLRPEGDVTIDTNQVVRELKRRRRRK